MAYSTFVNESVGTGKYAKLEVMIMLLPPRTEVYIVNLPHGRIPKDFDYVDMGDSIDVILTKGLSCLKSLPVPAGVVKYAGQSVALAHIQARSARDRAEERHVRYFIHRNLSDTV